MKRSAVSVSGYGGKCCQLFQDFVGSAVNI